MALSKSLLSEFDENERGCDVLYEGSEKEFQKLVESYQNLHRKYKGSETENRQLLKQLADTRSQLETLVLKNDQARKLLEREISKKKKFEHERDLVEQKLKAMADIILSDKNHFDPGTRDKLSFLERDRRSKVPPSKHDRLDVINELKSTGSALDADVSRFRNGRAWKRMINDENERPESKRKRSGRSSNPRSDERVLDVDDDSTATKLEAMKNLNKCLRSHSEPAFKPSAPPIEEISGSVTRTFIANPYRKCQSLLSEMKNRPHSFISNKTYLTTQTCTQCGKNFGFGKKFIKCNDCKASVHPECKEKLELELPCIPTAQNPCRKDFSVMEKLLTIPGLKHSKPLKATQSHATAAYSTRAQRMSVASLSDTPLGGGIRGYRRPQQYFRSPHLQN